ncbi:MAG: zinc-dependent metalloprotease [Balneolaceae bacterium]|nr:zinc-dependent metalloprotease [Balneolaceae bacterium]
MRNILPLLIALFLLVPIHEGFAQKKKKGEQEEKKEDKFTELTKDATHQEGFIDTYRKDGHLYLAIKPEMLDKDFLVNYEIAEGIGSSFINGGLMLNLVKNSGKAEMVALEKHDDKIYLVKKNTRYVSGGQDDVAKSIDLTFGNSVMESAKIEATSKDSVILIDAYDWFVSDLSNISLLVGFSVSSQPGRPGRVSFDKSRSFLEHVKNFPENTNIQAKLTFKNSEMSAPRTVPDGRYIPVGIHYSLVALPEQPMKTRTADDRVGYFLTVHKDFSDTEDNFFRRYVNRWRLECTDETAGQDPCEVKKPITYYIEQTVPQRYRKPLMDGVEAWGDAFRAAGFNDAIRAEMLPEDADAEDIRYPTLRWNTADQPTYSAIGPSVVDPRTGEILDADILFEANMLLGFKNNWRNLVDPVHAVETAMGLSEEQMQQLENGGELSNFAAHFSDQGMFLRTALISRGLIQPDQPVPDEFLDEAVKWVTMHEVGHTLGLRHNFRSSADTPLDRLHDKQWTRQNGVFGSVMEYPTPNVAPEGVDNGYYYNPGVGSYDRWVVSYGYTPDDSRAGELARQSAKDGHYYGTDPDAYGPAALDPTVNIFDLSGDPLAWSRQRADLAKGIIPQLDQHVLADNVAYYNLTDAFQNLLGNYFSAVANSIKYIGGEYLYRDHMGDPGNRGPFQPISMEDQQEALDFIIGYGFSEQANILPQEIHQKIGADRWFHWGNSSTYGGRTDYPLHEILVSIQTSMLYGLTHPYRLNRIRDAETKYGADQVVGIPELMEELTNAVWNEVWTAPGSNIPAVRRDLQRAHIDRMVQLLTDAPSRTPADARSVVRLRLKDLNRRISARLTPPTYDFDGYTRAHLEESQARIAKALEAGLKLEN